MVDNIDVDNIDKERYKALKAFDNAVGQPDTKAVNLNELAETNFGF